MYPNNGFSPLADLGIFQNCGSVIDLIYNPTRTELLLQAEERGLLAENGLAMLAAQAKKSAEHFTQTSIPDGKIEEIISKIARATRNIVLIGMPGCGKTSVGMALAKKTGREFKDTDEWITEASGKSISAIFAEDGEEAFRRMENEALQALCKQSGIIIATGGGVVKRPENRRIIRQNGIIVFLDRDVAELPISGRPISEREGVAALAAARLPLYTQWSECTIPVRGVEQTATDIFERFSGGAFL
jgi:shikimate dehydrogenase